MYTVTMKSKIIITLTLLIFVSVIYFIFKEKQTIAPAQNQMKLDIPVATSSNDKPLTIIAFGDSLTAGYGIPLTESYPSLLQEELQKKNKNILVVNMGVSGETTTGGLDRVNFVISQKPSIILLGLGANDMLRSSSPAIAKENLRKILQRITASNITVILLGMKSVASNGEIYNNEFDSIYTILAKEFNVPLVPFFLEGVVLDSSLNTSDGIHPNKAGYEKIIQENILPVLNPVLTTYQQKVK